MLKYSILVCSMTMTAMFGIRNASAGDLSLQDKQFVTGASSAGMLEVQLGQYASQNASNEDVKKFGSHMADDHSKANEELKTIANEKSIDLSKDLAGPDKTVVDRIENFKGTDFDKAYVAQMVQDHEKAVAVFEKESNDGSDAALKDFAQKTLPILKHHLEMAQDLNKTVGG
jgi:putative membrane protein